MLLIAFVKNTRQGGPVLGGGLTALGMLGGLFTANLSNTMPAAMNMIGILIPQAWVLKSWKMVLDGQSGAALLIPFAGGDLYGRRHVRGRSGDVPQAVCLINR